MKTSIIRSGLAALALVALLVPATGLTAKADTTTTRNIIYGVAAAAAALTLYNTEHKHQVASTVQGYLPDGSTVYQDGHVVSANGQSWYPSQYGQTVACSNQYCTIQGNNNGYNGYGYNGNGYNGNGYNGNGYNNGYNNSNNNDGDGDEGYNGNTNGYNAGGYSARRYNTNGYTANNARRRGHHGPQ